MENNLKYRIISILSVTLLFVFIIGNSFTLTADAALATGKAKWVGNIWADANVPSKFADYWNQITPENSTKWGSCESQQGVYNFNAAKAMYNYCKTNKIPFKFHTLIWGSQYPNWLNNLSGTARKTAVENWFKAASQNFPDAEYIDVVNEAMPGHAPFPFKNDIGGDNGLYGTGWDWIVWSFEKARQYFPNSKLLINDYNVLNEYSVLNDYIKVVNILKDRGLIDGVGCQSHGLENTNATNLKTRLDRLAATGVPIYISELDINIADDNTQKNKLQELFPVMYEHSAVKGITFWGYIQGRTWIPNSYLLRSDGSERPALTWLKQYMANVPDNPDTPVNPRSAFSKLEAESYNDQSGIQKVTCDEGTEAIGYIENGDYAVYKSIDFENGAAGFQARVSSAAGGGNIEIRLDNINGTLAGTCPVAGTGGWQVFSDVKCMIGGADGKHDLYLKFTGGSGYLFNVNWFTFSKEDSSIKFGDLNSDGQIDAIDFQLIKKHILGTEILRDTKPADLNADGSVDSLDFVLLKQYLLGMITKFPAEIS
ncbi:endo-1,4-beta-xylanase [Ruminiclostridium cellobioparum]|uniref:Beta-xylanase n=1 Tax=Ruminiclostridium cellobioparum subsp. termitidis CT1112 TaxID=1195236 RepID=S0FJC9_RUMCE|nr:endo-1,4-beta-xylanase [Ruminiclostridium cellobioparum]EMS72235.1 Beta-1,4-xylanase [Ruminiclostridium cellobioparum subsp. termitidis CT1112]